MHSESNDDLQQIEQRATAFVFGELDRDQATEFMREMDASPQVRAVVDSIREAVGALESEFAENTPPVTPQDRLRIHDAMRDSGASRGSQVMPAADDSDAESRRWVIGLASAAALLLACGLTLPALNRMISTNSQTAKLEQRILEIEAVNRRLEQEKRQALQALEEQRAATRDLSSGASKVDGGEPGDQVQGDASLADQGESSDQVRGGGEASGNQSGEGQAGSDGSAMGDSDVSSANGKELAASGDEGQSGATQGQSGAMQGQQGSTQGGDAGGSQDGKARLMGTEMAEAGETSGANPGVDHPLVTSDEEMSLAAGDEFEMEMGMGGMAGPDMMAESDMDMEMDMMMGGMMGPGQTMGRGGMQQGGGVPALGQQINGLGFRSVAKAEDRSGQRGFGGMGMDMDMDMDGTIEGRERYRIRGAVEAMPGFGLEANSGDRFAAIQDNPFRSVGDAPLSTFSTDVDTASYSKLRMYLMQHNRFPSPNAVRIEELVNYFDYRYPQPLDEHPFAAAMDIASCPWNGKHRLARIGIKGREIEQERPASNLVFLLDVSGSMNQPNKLPLVVDGMKMLVNQLDENDSVAIVVYAGAAGMVLDSTNGDSKAEIVDALDRLRAGGSTNGEQGIQLAYSVARDHFIVGGTNRVILCSDGDFNVGVTGTDALVKLAAENAKGGIYLSVLGFGMGNHNDAMMEQVSNKANGNYAFIDTRQEARKVLVRQMEGTLVTIAKDVKIQVEFNPMEVQAYRLIGYENRMLAARDFNDDTKDAGEIGAGHTVTALYEIIPASETENTKPKKKGGDGLVDPLKYQRPARFSPEADSGEMLTLKLRYKRPDGEKSTLIQFPVADSGKSLNGADRDFQFAASVAAFGMLLRNSPHKGHSNFSMVEELAIAGADDDQTGYRDEFVSMVRRARHVAGKRN